MCKRMRMANVVVAAASAVLMLGGGVSVAQAQQCQANELAKLLADDGEAGDYFGLAVSIDGDVAVVGASFDESRLGSAYVFELDGTQWIQRAKLTASGTTGINDFGSSVDISGDVVVVGALFYPSYVREGRAYVFVKPESGWVDMTETAILEASDVAPLDEFGTAVSVSGSGDTVVVGSPLDGAATGAVYVFEEPLGGWAGMVNETAKLTDSHPSGNEYFGAYTAIVADGNTIVVGEKAADDIGFNVGSAYIFEKPPGGWVSTTETAKLLASDGAVSDGFGTSAAISGDTVVIGAFGNDDNGTNSGSAYVFMEPIGGWGSIPSPIHEDAKLLASDGAAGDELYTVAISGDIVLVGAYQHDHPAGNSGSAYAFMEPIGGWGSVPSPIYEDAELLASDGAPGDHFGRFMVISGDTAMIGAYFDDNEKGNNAGSVYVFTGLSDCNENGTLDICDIADGTSLDLDGNGIPDECDNQPPIITCNGPVSLWPPNHRLVDVSSSFTAWDADEDEVTLTVRVFCDEPEGPEAGDDTGDHAPDFKDEYPDGRGLLVRAERQGEEDGRVYIFLVTASDGVSETTAVCAAAAVPHDRSPASRASALAQAAAAQIVIQDAVGNGDPLPPVGFHEHGLSGPIGPKQ